MKKFLVMIVLVSVALSASVQAEDRVGWYYYNAFETKPLPAGTPVWVNLGDSECAYKAQLPSATDACMKEYEPAKIAEVTRVCIDFPVENPRPCSEWRYAYRVEFQFLVDNGKVVKSHWNGGLDDAYAAYNLPEKWAKYSKYFILLNW